MKRLETLQAELDELHQQEVSLAQAVPSIATPDINDLTDSAMDGASPELSQILQQADLRIEVHPDGSIETEGKLYQ